MNTLNTLKELSTFYTGNFFLRDYQSYVFKSTTYYRNTITLQFSTKLVRKSFFRRRHINNWLIYHNLYIMWSRHYLTWRRSFKGLLVLNTYKYSYILENFLTFSNYLNNSLPRYTGTLVASIDHSVYNFFKFKSNPLWSCRFLSPPLLGLYLTSFTPLLENKGSKVRSNETLYGLYNSSFSSPNLNPTLFFNLDYLIRVLSNIINLHIATYYRIMILPLLVNLLG